jgi:N-acetylglutamate synthase-like GNAT family acetyltransferase
MLLTYDMETRKDLSPWLAGVYVKSAYRKRGIASRLICCIEQEAATLGVRRLYLYAPTSVEAFYSRRGWQLMERCEYKGIGVVVMHKPVDAQATSSADAKSCAAD